MFESTNDAAPAQREQQQSALSAGLVCTFFLVAGMVGVVLPYVVGGMLPGGIHDARLNRFILEHFFQVITGGAQYFTEPPIFYPWIDTIALSDTNWGTAPVYSMLRFAGVDPERAFAGWFAVGFILNYLSAYAVFRLFGLRSLGAAAGAFLFSFGLPVVSQDGHAQLLYRFCVPWAVWVLYRYLDTRDAVALALLMLLVALQLLISFYIGVFLVFLLGAYLIVLVLERRPFASRATLVEALRSLTPVLPATARSALIAAVLTTLAVAILLVVAIPYLQAVRLYHLSRPWWEIDMMLPRLSSYLWTDRSQLWAWVTPHLHQPPRSNEHSMLFGMGSLVCLFFALASRRLRTSDGSIRQNLWVLAILVLLTLRVGGFSVYALIGTLPGLSAIRAVARIVLVMLFPVALITGRVLDDWWTARATRPALGALALSASLFLMLESTLIDRYVSTIEEWHNRLRSLRAEITTPLNADSIIVVDWRSDIKWEREIDAMLLAQSLNATTMNGYSGNWPPRWKQMKTCRDISEVVEAGEKFRRRHSSPGFEVDIAKIVPVGFGDCTAVLTKFKDERLPLDGATRYR